jgi:hypothetical protein
MEEITNEEKLSSEIDEFGWKVILLEATDYLPSFAYTIGLWHNYNHPELISFGLTTKTLADILNIGGDLVKSGQVISIGKTYDDFFENSKTEFIKVDSGNIPDYFGYAINSFYGANSFSALQLVWTDRKDNFPWNIKYEEEFKFKQPLLDRNAEFKFREEKNLAIFTTRQWLDLNKPILRVVHDEDGDWQFLTGDQMPEDAKVVCLEEMVLRDKTLNEVFDLDYGEQAERESIGGQWFRMDVEYDE